MRPFFKILPALILTALLSISCYCPAQPASLSGTLIIFHAGSLAVPVKEIAAVFRLKNPGVTILTEAAGSVDCARKITDLHKPCDIMISADYTVIDKMLIPQHATWNIQFASNEMCLVFNEKSKYGQVINANNWPGILLRSDVRFSRSDPNSDPCGYRSEMTMQLAEKHYRNPGLAGRLTTKDRKYIRPKEVDLLPLLETNTVDFIFLYKSVAIQHGLKYLELPDEVNLKNPAFINLYHTAAVEIDGSRPGEKATMFGEPMIYGVTILRDAPNKPAALAFLKFMLSEDGGMKILRRNGQPSLIHRFNPNYHLIPPVLRPFASEYQKP